jgi:site-specific recombinase XerD
MQTSLTLSLDKRRSRKDGKFPVIIRLGHYQKTTSIATGKAIPEECWDDRKKKIRGSYKGTDALFHLNNLLLKELVSYQDKVNKLQESGELEFISIKQLKNRLVGKNKYDSFFEFGEVKVVELKASNRFGTAQSYHHLINILRKFIKGRDVKFNEINYEFLVDFERYHLSKPRNNINGVASYMRTLRALYNKGIKEGIIKREAYPFYNYQIKTVPTAKRAIKQESIKKILQMELEPSDFMIHYRNYFILSYMLFGMSFIDMAFLKIENIKDGRIQFQRKKTSKLYDIKITEPLKEILDFYTKDKHPDEFILPVIKRETLELQYKDAKDALHRYNDGLKRLAERCNIDEKLTSYVSRHSFATHAMLKDIPLIAISEMLGHSKLNTTQIYLKSLPSNLMDVYQEELNKF